MNTSNRPTGESNGPQFMSLTEQAIAEALSATLPRQFVLENRPERIDVPLSEGERLTYTPDILIRNTETGSILPIEVKTSQSLSLANVMMFKYISAAYKSLGQDFILVICESGSEDVAKKNRLSDKQIHSIWARDGAQAATKIGNLLTASSALTTRPDQ